MRWCGRSEGSVSPPICRESPAANTHTSIISCTSPRPSERIFPASSVTSCASGSRFARNSSPNRHAPARPAAAPAPRATPETPRAPARSPRPPPPPDAAFTRASTSPSDRRARRKRPTLQRAAAGTPIRHRSAAASACQNRSDPHQPQTDKDVAIHMLTSSQSATRRSGSHGRALKTLPTHSIAQ